MLRIIKADKVNGIFTIEMNEKNLGNVIESVKNMVEKHQKIQSKVMEYGKGHFTNCRSQGCVNITGFDVINQ